MRSERGAVQRWVGIALGVVALLAVGGLVLALTAGDPPRPDLVDGADEPAGPPVDGGVLRMGLERPGSLDPALADRGLQAELIAADLLFDGLTALDPDSQEALPSVAAEWSADDTLKVWTFTLEPEARFHNGRRIRAGDVVFSLQRVAKRGPSSTASVQLELIEGYRPFAVDGEAERLAGLEVVDERTVRITLNRRLASFPLLMANPVYGIVPEEAVGPVEPPFGEEPVGSGPFRLERRTDDELNLVAAEGADVHLDGITVALVDDPATAYERFEDGDLDVVRVPADRVRDAVDRFGNTHFHPYAAELFYAFNLDKPKYANRQFRRAIVAAIDRPAVVDEVYAGTVLPLDAVVPDGVPGHQGDACPPVCHADRERAEELVERAFPNGNVPTVNIDYDEGAPQDEIARRIHNDLEAVGIPAELRPRPFDSDTGDSYQAFVASGDQELFRLGWIGAYPSPHAYLWPLFASEALDNVIGYSNPRVDDLLRRARRTRRTDRQLELYQRAERRILEDLPIVPLVQFQTHAVVSDRVAGFQLTVNGTFPASQVWLAGGGAGEGGSG